MWNDFGEYIVSYCNKINDKYEDSNCKIIEIAIGKFFGVSNYLINCSNCSNINFIATDINPSNKNILFDDIRNPNMDIYYGADLIYSIRPPQEIQPYIENISSEIGADLIVKPLFNEDLNLNLKMRLVNFKKAIFYESKSIQDIKTKH